MKFIYTLNWFKVYYYRIFILYNNFIISRIIFKLMVNRFFYCDVRLLYFLYNGNYLLGIGYSYSYWENILFVLVEL